MRRHRLATSVQRVVVVVPARNERDLLPGCLDALAVAAAEVPVPVCVVVALDCCVDGSELAVHGRPGVSAVRTTAGAAGAARRRGVRHGLHQLSTLQPAAPWTALWLASTDADSRVPPSWLRHQLEFADAGVDLVLGTVDLPAEHTDQVAVAWRRDYVRRIRADGGHPHVHGANLGVRASSYLAVGGFPRVAVHEDLALSRAVARLPGAAVVTTVREPVVTSARTWARAPGGVARDLRELTIGPATAVSVRPLRLARRGEDDYSWEHDGAGGAVAVPVPITG